MFRRAAGRGVLAAAVAVSLALLTGCGADDATTPTPDTSAAPVEAPQSLIDAAKQEGKLVFYGSLGDVGLEAAAKGFSAQYGIDTSYVRLNSAAMAQRVQAEFTAGNAQADVAFNTDALFMANATTNAWSVPMDAATMPSLSDIPKQYVTDANTVVMSLGLGVVPFNTDIITGDGPKQWKDLLDPKYKGKIVMIDPRASATYLSTWNAVYKDPNLGPSFLSSFAAQGYVRVADSSASAVQLVAAGEGAITLPLTTNLVDPLIQQGAPLKYWTFENPSPLLYVYLTMLAKSPHPNAAKLFVNWMMSQGGQIVVNKASGFASPVGSLPGLIAIPGGVVAPDDADAKAHQADILRLLKIT